jgi:outer membrane protein insertion porin family
MFLNQKNHSLEKNIIMTISPRNYIRLFPLLLLIIAFSLNASAQMEQNTYTIAGVSVEGNEYADTETIIALSGLQLGTQIMIPSDKIQIALKNLWKRKQFSDVEIVVEKITELGVFLLIKVQEFPRLRDIRVINNEELPKDDIIEAIGKVRGSIITDYDTYLAKKSIKAAYREEGLLFADVQVELLDTDTAYYKVLEIYVDEGVEFSVAKIEILGNEQFDDDDVADSFEETQTTEWWEFWASDKFDINEYEKDLKLIKSFYNSHGFIDAQVIKDTIIFDEEKESVEIIVEVYEGDRYYVRNINFQGNTVFTDNELRHRLDFKTGDEYDMGRFQMNLLGNEDMNDVSASYQDQGYLAIQLVPEEKRVGKDSVDLEIKVFENQRVKIRKVNILGNTKTKDKVIRRELYTRPGDYFSRKGVVRSMRGLGVLNYFNPEALNKDGFKIVPVDDKSIDITYKVEERSTDMINASIGFAGSYGLTGSIGFTLNNFSITEPLKGGAGQIFTFNAEFGTAARYQNFVIGFTEPWLFDEPTTVGINLFYRWYRYYINQRSKGIALNLGRRFRWPDDYFRGDVSFRIQENFVENSSQTSSYYNYYKEGLSSEVTIGLAVSRTSFNHLFFPSSGSRFKLSTNWAMGSAGLGTTDFIKTELRFDIAQPIARIDGMERVVLYLGTFMGYITGINSQEEMQPIELYYLGGNGLNGMGVTPLRGYGDRVAGARDIDDNIAPGRVISRYFAELRFALTLDPMPIYFYGFAEAGRVWNDMADTDPFSLYRSAGLGMQLMMQPIGIIGFSYGYGFDPVGTSNEPSGWKFLFHLGQSF